MSTTQLFSLRGAKDKRCCAARTLLSSHACDPQPPFSLDICCTAAYTLLANLYVSQHALHPLQAWARPPPSSKVCCSLTWTDLPGMQVQPANPICPAGSGKTTLLNSLAGQVPRQERLHLSGRVLVNGVPSGHAGHRQGYVQQEDLFYSQLTVKWAFCHSWLCAAGTLRL